MTDASGPDHLTSPDGQPQAPQQPGFAPSAAAGTSVTPVPLDQPGDRAPESTPRGGRKGLLIGAGVLAVALVGGGAAVAAGRLGGGGAQPDEAVPASALAFVAVDLDPSAGQKIDALRFLRAFPDVKNRLGASDDLRRGIFESLTHDGTLKGDYATDVEPWLGQRAAVAVLPPTQDGEDPGVVAVLAVTDGAKAQAGITKVTSGQATCQLTDDFAVCSDDAAVVKQAVADAAQHPLSESGTYSDDLDALGEQGVARGWLDLGKLADAVPSSGGMASQLGSLEQVSGRLAFALRFDGSTLELTGATHGTKATGVTLTGTAPMADLPTDTVAAVGLSGADQLITGAWANARKGLDGAGLGAQLDAQLQQLEQQYGLKLPDDVAKALGDHVAVVVGPQQDGAPSVAVRVAGQPAAIDKVTGVFTSTGLFQPGRATTGSDTVLATSQQYADSVAKGSGLASQPVFTDVVPGAKDSPAVAFVDVSKLLAQYGDQLGADAKQLSGLQAVGISARQDGSDAQFTLRVSTR